MSIYVISMKVVNGVEFGDTLMLQLQLNWLKREQKVEMEV